MSLENKILTTREVLDKSLIKLIDIFNKSDKQKIKDDIKEIIETQISYIIFLKELEIEINKKTKNISKEFIIQQFQNILESCRIIESFYDEAIEKKTR